MAAVFAAMAWGFQAMLLYHAPDMFRSDLEDMSFGWYVPLFSLYVLWTERRKVLDSLGAPSWKGLLFALPFLALGFLGVRGMQLRFEIVAFVGLLIAVPWAFFGARTARAILFPALFLLFCIPLATFLDVVTVHLRLLASSTAFAVARGVGADIVQQGTMVAASDGSFAIDVASRLRFSATCRESCRSFLSPTSLPEISPRASTTTIPASSFLPWRSFSWSWRASW